MTSYCIITVNRGKRNLYKKFQSRDGSFKAGVAVVEEEHDAVNFRDVASRTTLGELSRRRVRNSAQTSSAQVTSKP